MTADPVHHAAKEPGTPASAGEREARPVFALSPQALRHRLRQPEPLLLLDVRRPDSLSQQPCGILGAIPVILKIDGPDLPDVERSIEIALYGNDERDTDSAQVANWLATAGYRNLWRLEGGLAAWQAANLPLWQMRFGARHCEALHWTPLRRLKPWHRARSNTPATDFLRGLSLPLLREVAVLRVGVIETIAASWRGEAALVQAQRLMLCIASAASRHRAELHDFEGDGTTLYFADCGSALRAAFAIRRELCLARSADDGVPLVRLALDSAPLTLGHVGAEAPGLRCLIGPCVPTALRILKQAPPGGIVVTARVLKLGAETAPELGTRFKRMPNRLHVRNAEQSLPVFLSLPDPADIAAADSTSSTHD